jgi:hypothetical protein
MNYASVVFVGVILLAIANYVLRARHTFTGPVKDTTIIPVPGIGENGGYHNRMTPAKAAINANAAQIPTRS